MFIIFLFFFFFLGGFSIFFFDSFLFIWFGIEVISLSLVVIFMINYKSIYSTGFLFKPKIIFKYFFIQVVGAVIILFSFFFLSRYISQRIFLIRLIIKLRIFPRHRWVVEFYGFLSFWEIFLVRCVPKIPPLYLFFNFFLPSKGIIFFLRVLSLIVRVLRGYKSSSLYSLWRYSRILNIRWIFFSTTSSSFYIITYSFFIYILGTLGFFVFLEYLTFFNLSFLKIGNSLFFFFFFSFFSLIIIRVPLSIFFLFKFKLLSLFFFFLYYYC